MRVSTSRRKTSARRRRARARSPRAGSPRSSAGPQAAEARRLGPGARAPRPGRASARAALREMRPSPPATIRVAFSPKPWRRQPRRWARPAGPPRSPAPAGRQQVHVAAHRWPASTTGPAPASRRTNSSSSSRRCGQVARDLEGRVVAQACGASTRQPACRQASNSTPVGAGRKPLAWQKTRVFARRVKR